MTLVVFDVQGEVKPSVAARFTHLDVDRFYPINARSMFGAFHPNGSGYARMGDAAYKTMSEVLRGANLARQ